MPKMTPNMQCIVYIVLSLTLVEVSAFSILPAQGHRLISSSRRYNNWLGDLWEEVIEFSTYGPEERRLLKAQREAAAAAAAFTKSDISTESFRQAKQNFKSSSSLTENEPPIAASSLDDNMESSLSLQAFQAAVAAKEKEEDTDGGPDLDGYQLRDLLVKRWGVPLDIGFERGYSLANPGVYCTILPVVFGSPKCQHATELDYLSHLQAVIEILHKYQNLDRFVFFLQSTSRVPKPGRESVPYRLELSDPELEQILKKMEG
jgi:hypothetical protein